MELKPIMGIIINIEPKKPQWIKLDIQKHLDKKQMKHLDQMAYSHVSSKSWALLLQSKFFYF